MLKNKLKLVASIILITIVFLVINQVGVIALESDRPHNNWLLNLLMTMSVGSFISALFFSFGCGFVALVKLLYKKLSNG